LRQQGIAIGNIIGSNIYNILGVLGITGLVRPVEIPASIAHFDLWVMVAATLALIWFAFTGKRLTRLEGLFLALGYGFYVWLLFVRHGAFA